MKLEEELIKLDEEELYTNSDENRKLMKDILNIEKPFYKNLTAQQRKQYEEITDLQALNGAVTDKKIFTFAFSLATRLIFESQRFAKIM